VWRETNNCSGKGSVNHKATAERIARGEYCNVTVPPCEQTSGFCDCDGDGSLANDEPWFDCGNETLKNKGILCAEYCPKVCKYTFYSTDDCVGPDTYKFSLYGAPVGNIEDMYHYRQWVKKMNISKDANLKWKSVHVNTNGCSIDVFADKNCKDGANDFYASTFRANETGAYNDPNGMCNNLTSHAAVCVKGTRPCIHPEYNFTTTHPPGWGINTNNDAR
jgi:hypothetical protein